MIAVTVILIVELALASFAAAIAARQLWANRNGHGDALKPYVLLLAFTSIRLVLVLAEVTLSLMKMPRIIGTRCG